MRAPYLSSALREFIQSLGILVFLKTLNNVHAAYVAPWTNKLKRHQTLNVGFSFSWPVNRLCGILFNRFYRLEVHSLMVCIFDPACELLPPWTKELYLCTVAPLLYLLSDLLPTPLFPMYSICRQCVTGGGGGGFKLILTKIIQG